MKHMIFHPQQARTITEGDAGIVLTKEGGFFLFSSGDFNPEALTEEQGRQAVTLDAFRTALHLPAIMRVLVEMANDKSVITGLELVEKQSRALAN